MEEGKGREVEEVRGEVSGREEGEVMEDLVGGAGGGTIGRTTE